MKLANSTLYISVVVPLFQAEKTVKELVGRLDAILKKTCATYEIILVDDHSEDGTWESVVSIARGMTSLKGIRLSRNFGQHHAITAGLDLARGEWVVVMDGDLQDLPEEIPNLVSKANHGYDVVLARRKDRRDSWIVKTGSTVFYRLLAYLSGSPQDAAVGNFGIYHRTVIAELMRMKESIRYFPAMVKWVGFKQTTYDVKHAPAGDGISRYNFRKRFHLALNTLLAYSDKPLRMVIKMGFWIAFLGFIYALITFFRYLFGAILVPGYASIIVSIWVLSGLVLMTLGVVGLYVGKIFEGVKNRPLYIVEKST
ncbi:glycosyltransferase family 2 protein [Negadavirga shengliensis]|uniref:Glycosyltransferase family 2 protein n=1 Tax=Negadavirga shengliensis TaxID=1389218 RepID=A0ABV9T511_9BACT